MSTPTTPGSPKSPLPLLAIGLAILLALSLSLGGLTWWLVTRHGTTTNPPAASGSHPGPVLPPPARASADPTGTTEIFNGRDLEGWDYDPVVWSVRDGVIHGSKTRAGALFWRGAEVEDFELSFRFRLVRGNSGIYYRARQLPGYGVGGYEFEIYTNRTGELSANGTDRTRHNLFRQDFPAGIDAEWHEGLIRATGSRLIHQIDGQVYCDVEDTDPDAPRRGWIALASAGAATVDFKDLRLKRLSPR